MAKGACRPADKAIDRFCNSGFGDRDDHPINCIDWTQAGSFCRYRGGRLPREAEWELAARGSSPRTFPWGDEPPDHTRLNVCGIECSKEWPGHGPMHQGDDGFPQTAPVGSFPAGASPFGLLDAAGNVWEWTADHHLPYGDAAITGRWTVLSRYRVVRGGGWLHDKPVRVRTANRNSYPESESNGHLGVRCARDPG